MKRAIHKFIIKKNISPFWLDFLYILILCMVLLLIAEMIFLVLFFNDPAYIDSFLPIGLLCLGFTFIYALCNYASFLYALDKRKQWTLKREGHFEDFKYEDMLASYEGGSIAQNCYSVKDAVDRYKIYYRDRENKKHRIRAFMTWDKRTLMSDYLMDRFNKRPEEPPIYVEIEYYKYSKVLKSIHPSPNERKNREFARLLTEFNRQKFLDVF